MLYDRNWLLKLKQNRSLPLILIAVVMCVFICYCCISLPGVNPAFSSSPLTVPILLATIPSGEILPFSIQGPYKIFSDHRKIPYDSPGHLYSGVRLKRARASFDPQAGLSINNQPVPGRTMRIVPETNGLLEVNEKQYSGSFRIEAVQGGMLRLINDVDLEEYLAGVIFKEMPSSFHEEALKAQIVTARTYTLERLASGLDYLTDDTRSQVYGGLSAVTLQARSLVDETRGQVLIYEGKLLPAYYSSTCGGTSARAGDAFSGKGPTPLEQCHACGYCALSPYYNWNVRFSAEEIRQRFGLPDSLKEFRVAATAWDPMRRSTEITIFHAQQEVALRLSAETFRRKLNQGKSLKESLLSTRIERIVMQGNDYIFEGKGWGHGVGLCQYGAQGMALKGKSYRKILEYYFPDAEIVPDYGQRPDKREKQTAGMAPHARFKG
ncbi:MAG: SpoIID/LytB domain-containing protein [Planctomycetota bacterium]